MNFNTNLKVDSNPLAANATPATNSFPSATPLNLPLLVRTTLLSTTPNFDPKFYPKLHFKIFGDLSSVSNIKFWTPSEIQNKRRLVIFKNLQQLPNILNIYFSTISQQEMSQSSPLNEPSPNNIIENNKKIVISCIFNETDQNYYITSVDLLYLLEQLLNSRFTIDEKNRIRRNLQTLKPNTITKQKNVTFFNQIMGYSNPKPRNIEKNFKIFNWNSLNKALSIIMNKYSCDFYNVLNINLNHPLESKQKKKKSSRPSSSDVLNHNLISNNPNLLASQNENIYSYMQNNKSNIITNINTLNAHPSRQLSLPNIVASNNSTINNNFIPPSSSASVPQALLNKTRIPSVASTSSAAQSTTIPNNNNENIISSQLISSPIVYFSNNSGNGLQNTVNTINTTNTEANFYCGINSTNRNIKRDPTTCNMDQIVINNSSTFNSLPSDLMYTATANPNQPVRTINNLVEVPNISNSSAATNSKINQYSEISAITNHPNVNGITNMKPISDVYTDINNNRSENNNNSNSNSYNNNNNINNYNESDENSNNNTKMLTPLASVPQLVNTNASQNSVRMNDTLSLRVNPHNAATNLADSMVMPMINSSNPVNNAEVFIQQPTNLVQHQQGQQNYVQQLPQSTYATHPQASVQIQTQSTNYGDDPPHDPLNLSTVVEHIDMVSENSHNNINFDSNVVQNNSNHGMSNQTTSFNTSENDSNIQNQNSVQNNSADNNYYYYYYLN